MRNAPDQAGARPASTKRGETARRMKNVFSTRPVGSMRSATRVLILQKAGTKTPPPSPSGLPRGHSEHSGAGMPACRGAGRNARRSQRRPQLHRSGAGGQSAASTAGTKREYILRCQWDTLPVTKRHRILRCQCNRFPVTNGSIVIRSGPKRNHGHPQFQLNRSTVTKRQLIADFYSRATGGHSS